MRTQPAATSATDAANLGRGAQIALLLFVAGYSVGHHNGLFGATSAGIDNTRITDWIDLATPFMVLGPLLWFMSTLSTRRVWWVVAALGAITYAEGHGIHLSANSIDNASGATARAARTIHLWDEVVGHYVWYAGLAVVVVACTAAAHDRDLVLSRPASICAGGICGITWATNALEGGTAFFSLTCAGAAIAWSIRSRRGLADGLLGAGVVAFAIIAIYGLANAGFPQPSSR